MNPAYLSVIEDFDNRHAAHVQNVKRIDTALDRLNMLHRIREHLTRRYGPHEYPFRLNYWLGEIQTAADALIQATSTADGWDWGFPK